MPSKPYATTVFTWLTDNLGKRCLAPFCSQDGPALQAAVHIVALMGYEYRHRPELVAAWKACVLEMQPSCYQFAYHATAHVLDWPDRQRLWVMAGLPEIRFNVCAHEPRPQPAQDAAKQRSPAHPDTEDAGMIQHRRIHPDEA